MMEQPPRGKMDASLARLGTREAAVGSVLRPSYRRSFFALSPHFFAVKLMTMENKQPSSAAIIFPLLEPNSNLEGREYWPARAFSPNGPYIYVHEHDEGGASINAVSYHSLAAMARRCAKRLEALLDELCAKKRPDGGTLQSIVGIAIPEGPLLPVAVLAVHMIQMRHYSSNIISSLDKVPILLPIDPDEPMHRLRRILEDSKPECMVCAGDGDVDKMSEAISAVSGLSTTTLNINELLEDSGTDDDLHSVYPWPPICPLSKKQVVSHICFTSGTSGRSKGCTSSIPSLLSYLDAKNCAHGIVSDSVIFLASSISFDPCFSDILATFAAGATLAIAPRRRIYNEFASCLAQTKATHVLCTPTLWSTVAVGPSDLPYLEVVALGGERIPKQIAKRWARRNCDTKSMPRLLATYGTTEACVYQTCGEVLFAENDSDTPPAVSEVGQDVGLPLLGNVVRICLVSSGDNDRPEESEMRLHDVAGVGTSNGVGEVVLAGSQLDGLSGYWKRPDLTEGVFVDCPKRLNDNFRQMHYRTGDLGYLDAKGRLHILGRISGEDGMVKINGTRVELGEVECAIVDDIAEGDLIDLKLQKELSVQDAPALVLQCAVSVSSTTSGGAERINLTAYCVLSEQCLGELGIHEWPSASVDETVGLILTPGSALHTLLRMRTASRVRKGCVPSNFVLIPKVPLGKTMKSDLKSLPKAEICLPFDSKGSSSCDDGPGPSQLLRNYGKSGSAVSAAVAEALNLPPSTESHLSLGSNFAALGGDSLAATRVVRSLYASHNDISNARHLGGKFGTLDGAFAVKHLLSARTLGAYVDWLDTNGVCGSTADAINSEIDKDRTSTGKKQPMQFEEEGVTVSAEEEEARMLYEALVNSTMQGHTAIALHLLAVGANPNYSPKGKKVQRMGKLADKRDKKSIFQSSPLHLACIKGYDNLVAALIKSGARTKVPDAAGGLPLLLNCSSGTRSDDEDERRLRIARLLLEYSNVPLSAKDAARQTVLHAGARSGHPKLLRYLMSSWTKAGDEGKIHIYPAGIKGGRYDWQDRWFRTPVHWAVLNGNVEALAILLEGGCSPSPCRPKASVVSKKTSAALESPLEICERVHGDTEKGIAIRKLLEDRTVSPSR